MKTTVQAGGFIVALALGTAGALAQTNPGNQPPGGGMHQPGHTRGFMPQPRPAYGVANRWGRAPSYARPYGMRPQRFVRYGENPATWSPRYRRPLVHAYGYGPRPLRYGSAPRSSYYRYSYRPRVRYAYAETPYAYDLPRETYATGVFATASTIGLHTYDYAYTTRLRPIAAYAGATGSYAGGYPIYNRPLAPAYPTPGCDCD
jgi:hypothetical protein